MKLKKKIIYFVCLLSSFSILLLNKSKVFAILDDRAYGYQTEELIHHEPHYEGSSSGYVHFRSRADIEDVTNRLLSIHSLYTYESGIVTTSEVRHWKSLPQRRAYCEYHWHTSLFNNDYKTVFNQH